MSKWTNFGLTFLRGYIKLTWSLKFLKLNYQFSYISKNLQIYKSMLYIRVNKTFIFLMAGRRKLKVYQINEARGSLGKNTSEIFRSLRGPNRNSPLLWKHFRRPLRRSTISGLIKIKFLNSEINWSLNQLFIPLRLRKAGRVMRGGARETDWATCYNGLTTS